MRTYLSRIKGEYRNHVFEMTIHHLDGFMATQRHCRILLSIGILPTIQ